MPGVIIWGNTVTIYSNTVSGLMVGHGGWYLWTTDPLGLNQWASCNLIFLLSISNSAVTNIIIVIVLLESITIWLTGCYAYAFDSCDPQTSDWYDLNNPVCLLHYQPWVVYGKFNM